MVYNRTEYIPGEGGIRMKTIMVEPAQEIELIDPVENKKYHGFVICAAFLNFKK